ncbi:DUF2169 domain-containing protein [Diaphorobacter sp. HDW4A]|uniref:DUF2169 family type VI secretion system accessory protein n=1 Tax=Diaphorobacter sp. HDW4A TaxID=2714924 RepID=UPI001409569F|nr:DUF2169 domain-containing protein [Diaphorobacter sp. HDW4A]QIL80763.1 DUF2169 domain-containing protein [Diaphorobacter sp. HDW4A]
MEFVCASKHFNANFAIALDITGREHLVVATKATWSIPEPGSRPRPLPPQPLFDTDTFYGNPGESALRCGDDFPRHKSKCDVILDAYAHSADGQPVTQLAVGLQVGELRKELRVIGDRYWTAGLLGTKPSEPIGFSSMPLHYGHAFGGIRRFEHKGQSLAEAHPYNPIGQGWGGKNTKHNVINQSQRLPNLENPENPVKQPDDEIAPCAFSAISRAWLPRRKYMGSFDEKWRREMAPFLPEDFDDRFNQIAPEDQQISYPKGGEMVKLINLMKAHPIVAFRLPPLDRIKLHVLRADYSTEILDACADTLFIETEAKRFSVTWRASTPIRRRFQEFSVVAIGAVNAEWWQQKSLGGQPGIGCPGCSGGDIS